MIFALVTVYSISRWGCYEIHKETERMGASMIDALFIYLIEILMWIVVLKLVWD